MSGLTCMCRCRRLGGEQFAQRIDNHPPRNERPEKDLNKRRSPDHTRPPRTRLQLRDRIRADRKITADRNTYTPFVPEPTRLLLFTIYNSRFALAAAK